jgi:predicted O-methyltransferase YrrM
MIKFVEHGGWIGADTCMEDYVPWIRPGATRYIESVLTKGSKVFEWGMGASTVWFAKNGHNVISMELDHDWFVEIDNILEKKNLKASLYCFAKNDTEEYADYILKYPDESFDFVLVDGRNRCRCLSNALSKVKIGGMLCLDNSERQEYAKGVALLDSWDGLEWGDSGWKSVVWQRGIQSEVRRVIFPNEDA